MRRLTNMIFKTCNVTYPIVYKTREFPQEVHTSILCAIVLKYVQITCGQCEVRINIIKFVCSYTSCSEFTAKLFLAKNKNDCISAIRDISFVDTYDEETTYSKRDSTGEIIRKYLMKLGVPKLDLDCFI